MIRLLSKSELDKAKTTDKMREVSEGIKLSRRVDGLRELAASEESKLEKYRTESLKIIQQDIAELTAKRDRIAKEAEKTREELSKETTLTRKERLNLEELKSELEKKDIKLKKRSDELDLLEIDIAEALLNAKDDEQRAEASREQADYLLSCAENEKMAAQVALQRAKTIGENAVKEKERVEEYLVIRETKVKEEETEMIEKQKEISVKEREISTEKSQLADQRATLERAIERLRKNRF
jgi:hypothetical protein